MRRQLRAVLAVAALGASEFGFWTSSAHANEPCGVHCRTMNQNKSDNRRHWEDQTRSGGSSSRQDPVDAAMGRFMGALLGAAVQQKFGNRQGAPQKPLHIETLDPKLMDHILNLGDDLSPGTGMLLFKGWAADRRGQRTQLSMMIDGTKQESHFVGRVKWADHQTTHVMAGMMKGNRMAFEEVLAIVQGSSPLGCRFELVGNGNSGTYKCPDRSGTFYLKEQRSAR